MDVYGGCADSAEAHHHAGLAVAAAGDGEGGMRERDEMPGPKGSSVAARDFVPHSDLPHLHIGPHLLFISAQEDPPLILVCSPRLLLSFTLRSLTYFFHALLSSR